MKKQTGNKLGIWSIAVGWLIPILGIILGIIGISKSNNQKATILNTVGIVTSVLFWILWILIL
jgi:hypothetical protein